MIAADQFGGFIGVIVGLLVLALAIMWLIFPVLVLSKCNELLKVQREIRAALLSANVAQSEIAKALQWMVNNWNRKAASRRRPSNRCAMQSTHMYKGHPRKDRRGAGLISDALESFLIAG